eukprot:8856299-Prorocentrum_lima.AAC.1
MMPVRWKADGAMPTTSEGINAVMLQHFASVENAIALDPDDAGQVYNSLPVPTAVTLSLDNVPTLRQLTQ